MENFLERHVVPEWGFVQLTSAVMWGLTGCAILLFLIRLRGRDAERADVLQVLLMLCVLAFLRENDVHMSVAGTGVSVSRVVGDPAYDWSRRLIAGLTLALAGLGLAYFASRVPQWYRRYISHADMYDLGGIGLLFLVQISSAAVDLSGRLPPPYSWAMEELAELVVALIVFVLVARCLWRIRSS